MLQIVTSGLYNAQLCVIPSGNSSELYQPQVLAIQRSKKSLVMVDTYLLP